LGKPQDLLSNLVAMIFNGLLRFGTLLGPTKSNEDIRGEKPGNLVHLLLGKIAGLQLLGEVVRKLLPCAVEKRVLLVILMNLRGV